MRKYRIEPSFRFKYQLQKKEWFWWSVVRYSDNKLELEYIVQEIGGELVNE